MSVHTAEQDRGISSGLRSRRQTQTMMTAPTPRQASRRRQQPAVQQATSGPQQPQQPQAGSCIDLTEQDDDDEPVLIGSARSSSPVLVQQRKAQQPSLPSAEKLHKRKRDSPKRQSCGICMEPLKTMACGPCGHVYCERCLKEAVKAQKKCPACRNGLSLKQIHRVFLPD